MIVLLLDVLWSELKFLNGPVVLVLFFVEHEFHAVDLVERALQLHLDVRLALGLLDRVYWRLLAAYQLVSF